MTEDLKAAVRRLESQGWQKVDGRDAIEKTLKFRNFVEAFGWMTCAAIHAETLNHHPEWSNVYNRVHVVLTTHDLGGLGPLDIQLADRLDALPS